MPDFAFLEHWQVELDEYEVNYLLYEDFGYVLSTAVLRKRRIQKKNFFRHELQALADQEWILFRWGCFGLFAR